MLLTIDLIARVCIGSYSGQCLYLGDVPFMLYINLSSLPIR